MRSKYAGKSGKFDGLVDEIVRFFEAKGFSSSTSKEDSTAVVSVRLSESSRDRIAEVNVVSSADGFLTVTFERFEGSSLLRSSALPAIFGGGFFTLKTQKISEALAKLEKEFWEKVDWLMTS